MKEWLKTLSLLLRQVVWIVLIVQSLKHFGVLLGCCMWVLVARVAVLDLELSEREDKSKLTEQA